MTSQGESTVKSRPILFSGPMVRAILEGRKTQTRRIVKPHPPEHAIEVFDWRRPEIAESVKANEGCYYNDMDGLHFHCKCPYGTVGDRLWVRENFAVVPNPGVKDMPRLRIGPDGQGITWQADWQGNPSGFKWKPSIHMPRWASRIMLEIIGVRVERLRDISEGDAVAEGVVFGTGKPGECRTCAKGAFMDLWNSINGTDAWLKNPYVWVIAFKKVTQ